jgi:ankyrin repeat protein
MKFQTPNEFIQCVNFMITNGADINAQDKNGFTPLHLAVITNNSSYIILILEANLFVIIIMNNNDN